MSSAYGCAPWYDIAANLLQFPELKAAFAQNIRSIQDVFKSSCDNIVKICGEMMPVGISSVQVSLWDHEPQIYPTDGTIEKTYFSYRPCNHQLILLHFFYLITQFFYLYLRLCALFIFIGINLISTVCKVQLSN